MSVFWDREPPGLEEFAAQAACRGCAAALWRSAGGWEDADGGLWCIMPLPGSGAAPVRHQPMPDGLRGAPVS